MKSSRPKVLHELAGRPIIEHVLRDGRLAPRRGVGRRHRPWRRAACAPRLPARPALQFAVQSPQLGTGHALLQAESALAGKSGTVLLLYADVPLLQPNTLTRLVEHHRAAQGRRDGPDDGTGRAVRVRPHRPRQERADHADRRGARRLGRSPQDPRSEQRHLLFRSQAVCSASLHQLATDNAQGEYYLTDLVSMYRQRACAWKRCCSIRRPSCAA